MKERWGNGTARTLLILFGRIRNLLGEDGVCMEYGEADVWLAVCGHRGGNRFDGGFDVFLAQVTL